MMRSSRRDAAAGVSVGESFNDIYLRVAAIYERAARLFRTLPETRAFLLHQSAAFRQGAAGPLDDPETVLRTSDALLRASEHYLDEVEASKRSHVVPGR